MLTMAATIALAGASALAPNPTSTTTINADQQIPGTSFQVISDTEIIADGQTFHSWNELYQTGYFQFEHTRCDAGPFVVPADDNTRGANNCSGNRTIPSPQFDPTVAKYRIPVVVHIIQQTNGTGSMPDSRVTSQIEILNEDYQALAGTNGAPGTDGQIEFYLATVDPDGNPTTGITRSTNNTWFNDGGGYWNSLAWDTNRYLNIYTNNASGALGYVPNLPQGGIVGLNADRVVILYSTFGRNAPFAPFDLGRTVTHEVGHYFGLEHTFQGACSNGYTSGDLIMDTNPESSPTFGCPNSRSTCGGQPAPFHNYMDYSDDICMNQFTPEQVNRMRCTLLNYRPDLYTIAASGCSPADFAEPFGALDFFDVSAFLSAFGTNDAAADFNNDGAWNFFDVSDFLTVFGQGCP